MTVNAVIQCNFNPRPHEEGDKRGSKHEKDNYISIHALTRRATGGFHVVGDGSKFISIHALTRRATYYIPP